MEKDRESNVLQYVENYAMYCKASVLQKDQMFDDFEQSDELSSDSRKQPCAKSRWVEIQGVSDTSSVLVILLIWMIDKV